MFHPQQQIGPYSLVRLLGRGGFGEVWLAEKRGALMTAQVAIKLPLDPDPDLDAIRQEAHIWLSASGHPNVLPVLEADIIDGQVVIVSEYASGGSLASWLKANGGKVPSVVSAVALTDGILAGLEHLHGLATPIIHRDLKPDNVLLQGQTPRLTDFGISRVLKSTQYVGQASGTPHYMPPEAFQGHYSAQSDLWAVGAMLYQMLNGKLPFPQSDIAGLYGAILNDTPSPLPDTVSASVRSVVMQALEKDPKRRPASASAMRALLHTALAQPDPSHSNPQQNTPALHASLSQTATIPSGLSAQSSPEEITRRKALKRLIGIGVIASLGTAAAFRLLLHYKPDLILVGHSGGVLSVAFSPDGQRIVTGSDDKTAKVWSAETGRELLTLTGHSASVVSAAFSPDGKRIVTVGSGETVEEWNADTGEELQTLIGHSIKARSASFSPDGKRIITASVGEKTAKVWDVETRKEWTTLTGHQNAVNSVAFSPDSRRIVTSSTDKTAKVWDTESGRELLTLTGHTSDVTSAVYSPDGKRILTGSNDDTAKVWDGETGRELLTLTGHSGWLSSVAFSPDGKRIVTGSIDNTAKIWNAETGKELLTLAGHSLFVYSAAFSPDGKRIVTGSADKTAKVWTLPPDVAGGPAASQP